LRLRCQKIISLRAVDKLHAVLVHLEKQRTIKGRNELI
jgi:hypothetical protein